MTELFNDIPESLQKQAKFVFDMAIRNSTLLSAVNVLTNYINSCGNEREKEFIQFYFSTRLMELKNE